MKQKIMLRSSVSGRCCVSTSARVTSESVHVYKLDNGRFAQWLPRPSRCSHESSGEFVNFVS